MPCLLRGSASDLVVNPTMIVYDSAFSKKFVHVIYHRFVETALFRGLRRSLILIGRQGQMYIASISRIFLFMRLHSITWLASLSSSSGTSDERVGEDLNTYITCSTHGFTW